MASQARRTIWGRPGGSSPHRFWDTPIWTSCCRILGSSLAVPQNEKPTCRRTMRRLNRARPLTCYGVSCSRRTRRHASATGTTNRPSSRPGHVAARRGLEERQPHHTFIASCWLQRPEQCVNHHAATARKAQPGTRVMFLSDLCLGGRASMQHSGARIRARTREHGRRRAFPAEGNPIHTMTRGRQTRCAARSSLRPDCPLAASGRSQPDVR